MINSVTEFLYAQPLAVQNFIIGVVEAMRDPHLSAREIIKAHLGYPYSDDEIDALTLRYDEDIDVRESEPGIFDQGRMTERQLLS